MITTDDQLREQLGEHIDAGYFHRAEFNLDRIISLLRTHYLTDEGTLADVPARDLHAVVSGCMHHHPTHEPPDSTVVTTSVLPPAEGWRKAAMHEVWLYVIGQGWTIDHVDHDYRQTTYADGRAVAGRLSVEGVWFPVLVEPDGTIYVGRGEADFTDHGQEGVAR